MSEVTRFRRDPAPSRLNYRLNRMWLRPNVRFFVRVGLPLGLIFGAIAAYFANEDNRFALQAKVAEMTEFVQERPEFMVHAMKIEGASQVISEDIREIVPLDFPISSFHLDLQGIHARVAELDAVERVDVRIQSGGLLQLTIAEREPAAVWRVGTSLALVDATGHRVSSLTSRLDRPDLPLLAGEGVEAAVPEALALLAAADPISERVRGLLRVGERRWDVMLDREQRIMLPETGGLAAMERIMALHVGQDLLDRDLSTVDYRNPDRPVIRLNDTALRNENETLIETGANQ